MTCIVENSFFTNNNIYISKKIKNIDFFSSFYLPIDNYKNLDKYKKHITDTSLSLRQREIQYKIIHFFSNREFNIFDFNINFNKSLYQTFLASSILVDNHISFTVNSDSFVTYDNKTVLLFNFSNSFYFPIIKVNNLRSYFSLSLLDNPYIPIDIFLITYFSHNTLVTNITNQDIANITDLYCTNREIISKNNIYVLLYYLKGYSSKDIIKYLLQFTHTWSYFSLSLFFINNYSELLKQHSLYDVLYQYVNSDITERKSTLINDIHDKIFII